MARRTHASPPSVYSEPARRLAVQMLTDALLSDLQTVTDWSAKVEAMASSMENRAALPCSVEDAETFRQAASLLRRLGQQRAAEPDLAILRPTKPEDRTR